MIMKLVASLGLASLVSLSASANTHSPQLPSDVTFSTLITMPLVTEGLTGDRLGNLYTTGRSAGAGVPCPVWRTTLAQPALTVVGYVPPPSAGGQCNPLGLAFNSQGDLFLSEGNQVYVLTPNASLPPMATVFASGVLGTNGLAFDRHGNLWTGDGVTGQGRVWKITTGGAVSEEFRVQPLRNSAALGGTIAGNDGVGRQVRHFPPGTLTNSAGGQDLVANGLAFNHEGDLLITDTARGAIWKVAFDGHANVQSRRGCDSTFTANTLCLANVFVAHPLLEGADGIALDRAGNIWVAANERNAIVVVTQQGNVTEVFRNPPLPTDGLRNNGPLEFPSSPFLLGNTLCTANFDAGSRRDNSPNTAGEIGGTGQPRGKISCMNQPLTLPGLPLPIGR